MFKLTVSGKSGEELRQGVKHLYKEFFPNGEPPPIVVDEFGYVKPTPTVPHIYPAPADPQEAHDKLEAAMEEETVPKHLSTPDQIVEPDVEQKTLSPQTMPLVTTNNTSQPTDSSTGAKEGTDSRGMPWDQRIHSESRATNKDGTWRYRRNVEDSLVAKVETELRSGLTTITASQMQTFAPPPMPPAAVQVSMPTFQAAPPVQEPVAVAPVAQPTYNEPVVAPAEVKPAHTFESFLTSFIPTLAGLIAKGVITPDYVQQLCQHFGVTQIWQVKDDAAKARELFESFVQFGFITNVG